MHQDLTTWFGSQAHVDEPCVEGRPYLDDLARFGRAPLKNLWMIVGEQQVQFPWCFISYRQLLKDEFTFYGRLTMDKPHLSFPISCPFCPCVVRIKNVLYPFIFFLPSFFFFFLTRIPIWHVSIMAFRFSRQMTHGLSWLVTSLRMLNLVAYKQWNSSPTLLI